MPATGSPGGAAIIKPTFICYLRDQRDIFGRAVEMRIGLVTTAPALHRSALSLNPPPSVSRTDMIGTGEPDALAEHSEGTVPICSCATAAI
ncbi:hypothetical protein [Bradyrhizobium sp. USDA 4529]